MSHDKLKTQHLETKPSTTTKRTDSESCRSMRRKRVGKNAARERTRVQLLKQAFSDLQRMLPDVPEDTKLSRLDVLLLAINYMSHLMNILSEHEAKSEHLKTKTVPTSSSSIKKPMNAVKIAPYVAHSQWLYRSSLKTRKSSLTITTPTNTSRDSNDDLADDGKIKKEDREN